MERVLLTPEDAAQALSVGRTRVYELIATGALRSVKVGRSRRIPRDAIHEFVTHLDDTSAPENETTQQEDHETMA